MALELPSNDTTIDIRIRNNFQDSGISHTYAQKIRIPDFNLGMDEKPPASDHQPSI